MIQTRYFLICDAPGCKSEFTSVEASAGMRKTETDAKASDWYIEHDLSPRAPWHLCPTHRPQEEPIKLIDSADPNEKN